MADLSINVGNVRFKNPIIAAGSTVTLTVHNMKKCIEAGIGGIETKSISENEVSLRWQYPGNAFLDNRSKHRGLLLTWETAFVSLEQSLQQLREIKPMAEKNDVRLIWNLALEDVMDLRPFGGPPPLVSLDQWCDYIRKYEKLGADVVMVNGPCPIVISDQAPIDFSWFMDWYDENVPKIVKTLKQASNLPVWVKNNREFYPQVVRFANIITEMDPDVVQAGGSVQMAHVDIENAKCWVPGPLPYRKGHVNWAVAIIATNTNVPVTSAGNLETWEDVVERMMCGARAVFVATSIMHRGYKVITEMVDGLGKFMDRKGYKKLEDIVGLAIPTMPLSENFAAIGVKAEDFAAIMKETEVPKDSCIINVDQDKCTGCKKCLDCLFEATSINDDGKAEIDLNVCERCGCCWSMCPAHAISLKYV